MTHNPLIRNLHLVIAEFANGDVKAFATRINAAESTVYRWINGESKPQPRALMAIRRELGVSIDWLKGGDGPVVIEEATERKQQEQATAPQTATTSAGIDIGEYRELLGRYKEAKELLVGFTDRIGKQLNRLEEKGCTAGDRGNAPEQTQASKTDQEPVRQHRIAEHTGR
jgi:transcriptional regulator with XRE-family HTH domain